MPRSLPALLRVGQLVLFSPPLHSDSWSLYRCTGARNGNLIWAFRLVASPSPADLSILHAHYGLEEHLRSGALVPLPNSLFHLHAEV